MEEMTKTTDEGKCPRCKKLFNAVRLCNYTIGTHYLSCPHCGVELEIYTSVEYHVQVLPEEEDKDS